MVVLSIHSGWQLGGSTLNLGFIVKNLVESSHQVYVMNRYRDDEGSRYLEQCGAGMVYFSPFSLRMNTTTILESSEPQLKLELTKMLQDLVKFSWGFFLTAGYIMKYRPSLVYLTESALPQSFLAAKFFRLPVVCELQAELIKGRWGIRRSLLVRLLSRADVLFGITRHHVEPFLSQLHPRNNIYVIPNTIDVESRKTMSPQLDVRSTYEIPNEKKIVCYFGGASRIKGYQLYLEIVQQIASERNDLVFLFAGPFHRDCQSDWAKGSSRDNLADTAFLFDYVDKNNLAHCIRIIGEVADVISIISQSDLVIAPNAFPHFSRTVVEAFYCTVPALASDDKFNRDLIDDGVTGFLATFGDVTEWTRKIHLILDDPAHATKVAQAGHEVYESTFDPAVVSNQIRQVFQTPFLKTKLVG